MASFTEPPRWTKEILDKRRQRAKVLAWLLAGFVVLIIFVTIARIGGNIANRPPIGLTIETIEGN